MSDQDGKSMHTQGTRAFSIETVRAVSILKQMIATKSFSTEEKAVADLIETHLKAKGIRAQRFLNNIWARNEHYDRAKPTLLLCSHLDTVKPNPQYTLDPFNPEEKDDLLYGLGSNDAGASVVCMIDAFIHFYLRKDLRYNLTLALTAEEEISGKNGIEALLPNLGPIDCGIVGEPTSMKMAIAEKGLLVIDCVAKGRAGHAAREEGENAITKALPDLNWFHNYKFENASKLLGPNKMTVTILEAGTLHNIVPGECKFTVDIRLNELYTHDAVLATIKANVGAEVTPRSTRIKATSISMDHPLVKAGLIMGRPTYGSPTTSDKALMPFPTLKMGPGDSARSHTADEYVKISEITDGIRSYRALIEKVIGPPTIS